MNKAVLALSGWLIVGLWLAACAGDDPALGTSEVELALERLALADAGESDSNEIDSAGVPYDTLMRVCHERAQARGGPHEVHGIGQYLALGDTMLAVHVPLPDAPELARCIEEAVADEPPPGPPGAPNAFASGSFAIDLGGPPPPFTPGDVERHLDAHRAGLEQLVRQVVARGVLPADHFFVREVLEGS